MLDHIRLLPVLIVSAALLLMFKIDDVWDQAGRLGFPQAQAQSEAKEKAEEDQDADAKAGDKEGAKQEVTGAEPANGAAAAEAEKADDNRARAISEYSPAEIQVLQSLSKRRQEIESRQRALRMRVAILAATEKRIDGKIAMLKQLEAKVQSLIKMYDKDEEARLRSLVKVYENMKPRDAARILENLEMNILVDVAERMKEVKMAAVMAKMDPEKARTLTVQLATRRQLPQTGG